MTWLIGCAIVACGIASGVTAGVGVGMIEETWSVPAAIAASVLVVVALFKAGGWL